MTKPTRLWPSLIFLTLIGAIACAGNSGTIKPKIGPAFIDKERDLEGSRKRYAEFDVVCVAPTRLDPPEPPMAPAWCRWTKSADKVIRANNAIARD